MIGVVVVVVVVAVLVLVVWSTNLKTPKRYPILTKPSGMVPWDLRIKITL